MAGNGRRRVPWYGGAVGARRGQNLGVAGLNVLIRRHEGADGHKYEFGGSCYMFMPHGLMHGEAGRCGHVSPADIEPA
jgi:hypothetical protein